MGARIHIVIPAHLAMAPRAQREAVVLRRAGHAVTVSGACLNTRLARIDRELAARLKIDFRPRVDLCRGVCLRIVERAAGRWARWRFETRHRFSPALLGYGLPEQLRRAKYFRADLTIAHGEAGLWIGARLLRAGMRVGVDFEDWFSRDLARAEWHGRPVETIAELESTLLHAAHYRTASSPTMARALGTAYGVEPPAVVTNAVAPVPAAARRARGPLRLIWLSQTIGPSRGLELLFQALPLVRSRVRVTLVGALRGGHRAWLHGLIPAGFQDRVAIEAPIAPWEVPGRIAAHDAGLVLETRGIVSRDLCLPNKLFHYFAGGLAIIATRTEAMREALASCPQAAWLVNELDPHELAGAVDALAACPARLAETKKASRAAGETFWNGQRDEAAIREEVERALGGGAREVSPASGRSIAGAVPR